MDIAHLRNLGKRLKHELDEFRTSPEMKKMIGRGASGDKTFVIDRKAEECIIDRLKASGEPCTLISEEIGVLDLKGGGKKILLDPIDGSKNAVAEIPFYGTSIAVADGDTLKDITVSYVINLVNGDEFWAERGSGSFMNSKRMCTQEGTDFSTIAYEAQVPKRDLPQIIHLLSHSRKTRCLGSIALDLAYLAHGALSVLVSPSPSRSFDYAAGWLLVKEAGGVISDIEGGSIDKTVLDLKRSAPLIASGNQNLHKRALALLAAKKKDV